MLPPYVYDLIGAVQKWEDEHGDTSMCFDGILNAVPKQELDRAAAIAHYQRETGRRTTCEFPSCERPEHQAGDAMGPPPRVALTEVLRVASEGNEQFGFDPAEKFEMNPTDAEYFDAWDVSGAFLNGWKDIPVVVNASVPAGWLRVLTAGNFRDVALPLAIEKSA